MKLAQVMLALALFTGYSAFAKTDPGSNAICPHGKKDALTQNLSSGLDKVALVMGSSGEAPSKRAPAPQKGTATANR